MNGSKPLFDMRLYAPDLPLTHALDEYCQLLQHLFFGAKPWLLLASEQLSWYLTNDNPDVAWQHQQVLCADDAVGAIHCADRAENWQAFGFRLHVAPWVLTVWLRQSETMTINPEQQLSLEQVALSIGEMVAQKQQALQLIRGCWLSPLPWQQPESFNKPLWVTQRGATLELCTSREADTCVDWPAEAAGWLLSLQGAATAQGRILHPSQQQLCQLTLLPVAADRYLVCFQDLNPALKLRFLLQELALYQGALETGLAGLIAFDPQNVPVFINQKARELLQLPESGYDISRSQFDHLQFYDMQDEMPYQTDSFSFLRKYASEKQCQCVVKYQDGSSRILEFRWAIRQDVRRADILLYCLCTDVTSQYQLRQTLNHIEHHLDHILEYSPVVLYQQFINYQHGFTYISPNVERLLGCTQERLLAEPGLFLSLVHADDRPALQEPAGVCEYRFWSEPEQCYIWLKDIRETDPSIKGGIYGALTNITVTKKTELEKLLLINDLEEQKQLITSTLNGLLDAVLTIDETGKILSCNDTVSRLLGFTQEELLERNVSMMMPPSDADAHKSYLRRYIDSTERKVVGEGLRIQAQHKSGRLIPMHVSMTELPKGKDGLKRFVSCMHDLTELERQQQQLVQSSKLSAVGALTSGIAHDFNNILGIIRGYADLLVEGGMAEVVKPAQAILKATERADFMIKNLLEFSTNRQRERQLIEAGSLLNEITPMLAEACGRRITLHIETPGKPCWLELEQGGLENALLNLMINAKHAMEGSGIIECICSVVKTKNSGLQDMEPIADECLCIEVRDSGCGMTDEVKAHIFDPFFSTKGANGTGLGLAQVQGFIQRCKGVIKVDSAPLQGTTFSLYFPLLPALQQRVNSLLQGSGSKEKTILLVDDETELLELHATMLDLAGFNVLTATNGNDALNILAKNKVVALVSDVVMPGMSGIELALQVKKNYPDLPVQLISGFADESLVTNAEATDLYQQRLSKPLQTGKLVARVREMTGITL